MNITQERETDEEEAAEETEEAKENDAHSQDHIFVTPPKETFTYFSIDGRNAQRKWLVNYLYDALKSKSDVTNKMLSFTIKCVHFIIPFIIVPLAIVSPIWVLYGLLIFCVFTKILFWYLNGCFLSNLEYKLNKDIDINVVDPVVTAVGDKISKKSRVEVTIKATNLLIAFLAASIIWKENRQMRA